MTRKSLFLTFPFPVLSTMAVMLGKIDKHITKVMKTETIQTQIFLMMNQVLDGIGGISGLIKGLSSETAFDASFASTIVCPLTLG